MPSSGVGDLPGGKLRGGRRSGAGKSCAQSKTTGEQIGSGQMGGGGAEGSVEGLERWEGGKDSMPWPDQASAHGMRVGLLSESKCKS